MTSQAIQVIDPAELQSIEHTGQAIEAVLSTCGIEALRGKPAFIQTAMMAHGIGALRKALNDNVMERVFMPLRGSALGFLTDMDREPDAKKYGVTIVRDCLIEGMMRGFRPVGNEMNIIAARFYGAKAGFERIVREFPGVSDFRFELGVPYLVGEKGALVAYESSWIFQGQREQLNGSLSKDGFDTRIPVRVNSGMIMDAILGKAERKMYARIYKRLTGCSADVIDGEVGDLPPGAAGAIPTTGTPVAEEGKRVKMGGNAKPAAAS